MASLTKAGFPASMLVEVAKHPLRLVVDLRQHDAGRNDQVTAGAAPSVRMIKQPAGIPALVEVDMRCHRPNKNGSGIGAMKGGRP